MAETKILQLEHQLSGKEIEGYGEQLAQQTLDEIRTNQELKDVTSDYREKLKKFNNEILRLSTAINTGIEIQEVECTVEYNKEKGTKEITRSDTGKTTTEKMNDDDYSLFT